VTDVLSQPDIVELRDSDEVRRYVLQGLRLRQPGSNPNDDITTALRWLLELANADDVIPPACFVADVGRLINAKDGSFTRQRVANALPADLTRAYEDYVLGKLYADATFERGSASVCRYTAKDQARGTAWLVSRFRDRADIPGIRSSPNVIRAMAKTPVEELQTETAELMQEGLDPLLLDHLTTLVQCVRDLGEVLGPEDVFELERGTALVEFGQRLAMRQVLAVAAQLAEDIPRLIPRSLGRERDVVTKMFREDSYPVGGFTSLSTRGSVESLLHSQLAFMERDEAARPDLFDIKFLRSELLYYSRDENEFMRRRRTIVFALLEDLVACRVKDPDSPWQRIIMLLGTLNLVTRQLIEWLSDESLVVRFVFTGDASELGEEHALLEMLFQEQIENGTVVVERVSPEELSSLLAECSRRSLTHAVSVACQPQAIEVDNILVTNLAVSTAVPEVSWESAGGLEQVEGETPWSATVNRLLATLL